MKRQLFVILLMVSICFGIKFTRCGLVYQLRNNGFPEPKMRDYDPPLVYALNEINHVQIDDRTPTVGLNYTIDTRRDAKWRQNRVCLVEAESSRRTDVVGPVNYNGSRDYGLFQINDNFWCSNSTIPGKQCQVTCSELITNDITKASICAHKIFKIQGFNAWHGWQKACQNTLPDISMC